MVSPTILHNPLLDLLEEFFPGAVPAFGEVAAVVLGPGHQTLLGLGVADSVALVHTTQLLFQFAELILFVQEQPGVQEAESTVNHKAIIAIEVARHDGKPFGGVLHCRIERVRWSTCSLGPLHLRLRILIFVLGVSGVMTLENVLRSFIGQLWIRFTTA